MQALVVTPGQEHSTRIEDVAEPAPREGEVLLRVLEVGVCGTDREIDTATSASRRRKRTHRDRATSWSAEVERDAPGFSRGDLVAATVRRSCGHCLACADRRPDSASRATTASAVSRAHGFARELVARERRPAHPDPAVAWPLGALVEPTSICARALRHARTIGGRQPWQLRRALVIGGARSAC